MGFVFIWCCTAFSTVTSARSNEFNLSEVADYFEENNSLAGNPGTHRRAVRLLPAATSVVVEDSELITDGPLTTSVLTEQFDGGEEFISLIRMVNEDYAAAIQRSRADRPFKLAALMFPKEEKYETLVDSFARTLPWRKFLYGGPSESLLDEWRRGVVLESNPGEIDGKDVQIVKLKVLAKDDRTGEPRGEVIRILTFEKTLPYRLLRVVTERKNSLIRDVQYSDWTELSGVHFPRRREEIFRNSVDGPMVRGNQTEYSFTDDVGDFQPEQTRLSYYGFPEPASPNSNRLGFWLGLFALGSIGGVLFFRKRRESARDGVASR